MTNDNPIETNEYGELVNPDQPLDEEIDTNEILEDTEEIEQLPSERDPTAGEITAEATSWENRINQYSAAADEPGLEPELVYEPANGSDISTAEVFSESDVLFAEIEDYNAEAVQNEGYEVVLADAEEFKLSRTPDLVVFRNSAMDETQALENNPAEYVFANNWLGSASNISGMEEYQMIGTVSQNETEFRESDNVSDGDTPDDLYVFQKTG